MERYDAVVVGAGPNGLAAAITMARAGRSVLVVEGADSIGGGTRTEELTLPGFKHDVCSAIHPFAIGSPFYRSLPLEDHGLAWAQPEIPIAHGVTPDRVVSLPRHLDDARPVMGARYADTMERLVADWPKIERHIFGPLARVPRNPIAMARFGVEALQPATWGKRRMETDAAALFAGVAAHAFLPLDRPLTSSFAWFLLAGAHIFGWPAAVGGSQAIADSMASYLRSLGGEIRTGHHVERLSELPRHRTTLLDLTPTGFDSIAGDRLPASYRRNVARYRYGPAAFKIDYALDGPMPWRSPELVRAGTIHLSGTFDDIAAAERAAFRGQVHPSPFLLVTQQSMFDPTRAPAGKHTLWVYAHVPNASKVDFSDAIERQLEAYAPGFRDLVFGRHVLTPAGFELRNPNLVGGDIAGGAHTLGQLLFRPFPSTAPYSTPIPNVYLCSSSTPPGGGTHGMCGNRAAEAALRDG
jgi:phytoene dehydrogenase-like protein